MSVTLISMENMKILMLTSHKLLKKHSQYFCCCSTLFLAATPFYEERGGCTPFKGVKI